MNEVRTVSIEKQVTNFVMLLSIKSMKKTHRTVLEKCQPLGNPENDSQLNEQKKRKRIGEDRAKRKNWGEIVI